MLHHPALSLHGPWPRQTTCLGDVGSSKTHPRQVTSLAQVGSHASFPCHSPKAGRPDHDSCIGPSECPRNAQQLSPHGPHLQESPASVPTPQCNGASLGRTGAGSCLKGAEPGAKTNGPGRTGRVSLEE